jgi:hypothetical protein
METLNQLIESFQTEYVKATEKGVKVSFTRSRNLALDIIKELKSVRTSLLEQRKSL